LYIINICTKNASFFCAIYIFLRFIYLDLMSKNLVELILYDRSCYLSMTEKMTAGFPAACIFNDMAECVERNRHSMPVSCLLFLQEFLYPFEAYFKCLCYLVLFV